MVKSFMLLLAFTITAPDGEVRDEKVHILSRHFDDRVECVEFVQNWGGIIKDRGLSTVQGMLAEGWRVSLDEIGCSRNPAHLNQAVIKVSEQVIDEDEPLPEHD